LKENHADSDMREFFFLNFLDIFEEDKNIPVHFLLDPLI